MIVFFFCLFLYFLKLLSGKWSHFFTQRRRTDMGRHQTRRERRRAKIVAEQRSAQIAGMAEFIRQLEKTGRQQKLHKVANVTMKPDSCCWRLSKALIFWSGIAAAAYGALYAYSMYTV